MDHPIPIPHSNLTSLPIVGDKLEQAAEEDMRVIAIDDGKFRVVADGEFEVDLADGECSCPDYKFNSATCKHQLRVALVTGVPLSMSKPDGADALEGEYSVDEEYNPHGENAEDEGEGEDGEEDVGAVTADSATVEVDGDTVEVSDVSADVDTAGATADLDEETSIPEYDDPDPSEVDPTTDGVSGDESAHDEGEDVTHYPATYDAGVAIVPGVGMTEESALKDAGLATVEKLQKADYETLVGVSDIDTATAANIKEAVGHVEDGKVVDVSRGALSEGATYPTPDALDLDESDAKIYAAVADGAFTSDEVAASAGVSTGVARKRLLDLSEADILTRDETSKPYQYAVDTAGVETLTSSTSTSNSASSAASDGGVTAESAGEAGDGVASELPEASGAMISDLGDLDRGTEIDMSEAMPVDRHYDFSGRIPRNLPEYRGGKGIWERIQAITDPRSRGPENEIIAHIRLIGETGTGKTFLSNKIGEKLKAPVFNLQGSYAVDEGETHGVPLLLDDQTLWVDATVVAALIASREGTAVLRFDEPNRTPMEALGSLFPALDERTNASLKWRGGEVIQGNPYNLIVVSTMNRGSEYTGTNKLDKALKRRISHYTFKLEYLGAVDDDDTTDEHPEQDLLVERTNVGPVVAEEIVKLANDLRGRASDTNNRTFKEGVPTPALVNWAKGAWAYSENDVARPLYYAGVDAVANSVYEEGEPASDTAREEIRQKFDDAPFDDEGFSAWR